ncbi:MAG: S9 family peptidase [Lachnospiraceae bacterium]|nr:S9 family peptidase [Lachnospiraceae bacterium]
MKTALKDFMMYQYPTNLAMSPDGKHGAFAVVTVKENENRYDSNIWLYHTETGKSRPFTSGGRERNFVWMDNETILFSGNREKDNKDGSCLYALNIHGGEAGLFAELPKKIGKMKYQNGAVYALVHEHYYEEEEDYEIFDELPFWSNGVGITNKVRDRLYRYDIAADEMKVLSPEYGQVEAFWVENGTVLFSCNVYTDKKMPQNGLYEYVEASGEVKELIPQGAFSITYACRRNGRVDFMGSDMKRFGYNENPDLYTIENGVPKLLARYDYSTRAAVSSDCRMPGGEVQRTVGEKIYLTSIVNTDTVLQCFDLDGSVATVTKEEGNVEMFDICGDSIYFIGMRDQGLLELYALKDGVETRLTDFNAVLADRTISPVEHITYTYKGVELDGFIIRPVDYDPDKKYPGILTIHGGPKGTYGPLFDHEFQLYASEGYFVFYTNPIGSDGRGNEFADIVAKQGSIDYEELMYFTDQVLELYPALDGSRLGVMGISYGGFMTNWIIGHTDRFKAAVPQCSIANWISKTNTTDIGYSFNTTQLGGDVWENHEKMWELSPMKYADRIHTPALIIHADEDYRCWLSEGVQMFSSLKYHGVPAKLFMIHGESHGVSRIGKPKKRVRRLEEILSWLNQWLKPEE